MNWSNNNSPLPRFSCYPSQPITTTTLNDPAFTQIYDYLRDFSNTEFDTTSLVDPADTVNTNTSDILGNSSVDYYQQSQTVNPVYSISTSNESQISTQEKHEQKSIIQFDNSKSEKIVIKSHPRSNFRPRTEKESQDSSHYIRCEACIQPRYPTILIQQSWKNQNNIIEIALVDKDKQPHPYTIDNKERKISSLIFKQNEPNVLYFHVTEKDYLNREKTFLIEYIKLKQNAYITKDLIKTRQLDQSMLRFTRFYQISDGSYQKDESSTEYSSIMTEDYGDFSIEDIFPLYGPMCGNKKVCVELKGSLPKDWKMDLIINITANEINWFHQIPNIKKNGTNFTFLMPPFPDNRINHAKVDIRINYKQETIHQSSYIYTRKLDEELVEDNSNESVTTVPDELTGAFPAWPSIGTGCKDRVAKRARE